MPDRIHVQRVTREQLHRVADGQGWAFVVEVEGKVVGVRVEVIGSPLPTSTPPPMSPSPPTRPLDEGW